MNKPGNRYGNAQYEKVGNWLKSEKGQVAYQKSQRSGDIFSIQLNRKVAIKETVLKETCKL